MSTVDIDKEYGKPPQAIKACIYHMRPEKAKIQELLAIQKSTLKAELLAKTKEAYRKGYNDNARDCLCSGDVPHRHLLDDGKSHNIRPDIKILEEL